LTKGLPQHHAYDLVWRHALAVDASGERLAFGSTSGGLWISEDGGDAWSMPEARLAADRCSALCRELSANRCRLDYSRRNVTTSTSR
jgi:hypothetical protein